MRDIKFRGKRVDNGRWAYGYYGWSMGKHFITEIINEQPTWSDPGGCYIENSNDVIPESVGQYVGLNDKNGNEIYEGDIVKHGTAEVKSEIIFDSGSFAVSHNQKVCLRHHGMEEFEVIGNIYENPELISKQLVK